MLPVLKVKTVAAAADVVDAVVAKAEAAVRAVFVVVADVVVDAVVLTVLTVPMTRTGLSLRLRAPRPTGLGLTDGNCKSKAMLSSLCSGVWFTIATNFFRKGLKDVCGPCKKTFPLTVCI
jgi:hypothetical protein